MRPRCMLEKRGAMPTETNTLGLPSAIALPVATSHMHLLLLPSFRHRAMFQIMLGLVQQAVCGGWARQCQLCRLSPRSSTAVQLS